jgi:hypothetical protein
MILVHFIVLNSKSVKVFGLKNLKNKRKIFDVKKSSRIAPSPSES